MVRIRLARAGSKKAPFYRIVVTDKRSPRGGKFLEMIGTFNPRSEPLTFAMQRDRYDYWCGKGASVSDTVASLVRRGAAAAKAAAAPGT